MTVRKRKVLNLKISVIVAVVGCNHTQPTHPQPTNTAKATLKRVTQSDGGTPDAGSRLASSQGADASDRAPSMAAHSWTPRGVAFVRESDKWHCLDKKGRHLATILNFDNGPDYASEGLIRYEDANKIGFVDEACKIRIVAKWDFAFPFSAGRAVVCEGCQNQSDGEHTLRVGGKWGAINRKGAVVVPVAYDSATALENHATP